MGDVRFEGELRIEPPLTYAELRRTIEVGIRKAPYSLLDMGNSSYYSLKLVIETENKETDEGLLITHTASAIAPMNEAQSYSNDAMILINRLIAACPGHRFTGYIEGHDVDEGGLFRIVGDKSGNVQVIHPQIVWPEV